MVLAELASPVVLVLDNLQRATAETLDVLRGLLFDRPVPGVAALLGWRSGEAEVDAWWRGKIFCCSTCGSPMSSKERKSKVRCWFR